jgi:ubiquitin-conjugating enzyme E2 Q
VLCPLYDKLILYSQSEPSPLRDVAQDPKFTAKTTLNKPIGIPQCATSISRAFRDNFVAEKPPPRNKRRKHTSPKDQLTLAEVEPSDDEDPEDIKFLFSDDEDSFGKGKGRSDDLILL